jgi:hypothetical protein
MGVVAGAFGYILARALEQGVELWLKKKDLELHKLLGEAILKMQSDLDKKGDNDTNKRT